MLVETMGNRRRYVRVAADFAVELLAKEECTVLARTADLSEGGVKIICDQAAAFTLLPPDQRTPGPVYGVELELRLFDQDGTETLLESRCRLVFFRRLAQDSFHFGLEFLELAKEQIRRLQALIQQQSTE